METDNLQLPHMVPLPQDMWHPVNTFYVLDQYLKTMEANTTSVSLNYSSFSSADPINVRTLFSAGHPFKIYLVHLVLFLEPSNFLPNQHSQLIFHHFFFFFIFKQFKI